MKYLIPVLVVGTGGFIGSALRFMLTVSIQRHSISFPYGTLWVNLLGCLAIGVIASIASTTGSISPAMRLLLATGVCGGFTTMSSFIYELAQLVREQDIFLAGLYCGITFFGCIVMFWVGSVAVRALLKS